MKKHRQLSKYMGFEARFLAAREILRKFWDPIGVSDLPDDEYDNYAYLACVMSLTFQSPTNVDYDTLLQRIESAYFDLDDLNTPDADARRAEAANRLAKVLRLIPLVE